MSVLTSHLQLFQKRLAHLYDARESKSIFYTLMEQATGRSLSQLLIHDDEPLADSTEQYLDNVLSRLSQGEPMQYILGEASFDGLLFHVAPGVLIPRPETEELVNWVYEEQKEGSTLDIGTGSGCIAIALKNRCPQIKVEAMDVSQEALTIAQQNAQNNKTNIQFHLDDILHPKGEYGLYQTIVSNPPYICPSEKESMRENVLNHEPSLALFVPEADPLLFYKVIADFASKHLVNKGALYFEINERFGKETSEMLIEKGFTDVCIRKDINEKERMIRCRKR